jgi:hypothetical protein
MFETPGPPVRGARGFFLRYFFRDYLAAGVSLRAVRGSAWVLAAAC